ncbi:MAG: polysaccharide deacetylase family protein [Candidatus Omnitrophica bacterium]|nr:polysaccharide deacetylase family protein [Candidatus Omnitrophota bacterium]
MFRRIKFIFWLFFALVVCVVFFGTEESCANLHKKNNKEGIVYWHGDSNQSKVALTFDDGPNEPYTSQILDILKEFNIKATFFLIGKNVQNYPEVARRIIREGHIIGNHTHDHPELILKLNSQIRYQIKKTEEVLVDATGVKPYLFRPPYGLDTPLVWREAEKLNYIVIKWSASAFNGRKDMLPGQIVDKLRREVENGSIILFHDGNRTTKNADRSRIVEALPMLIESLQKRSYQFVTVPQLLGFEN